jgi:hypothetical protein
MIRFIDDITSVLCLSIQDFDKLYYILLNFKYLKKLYKFIEFSTIDRILIFIVHSILGFLTSFRSVRLSSFLIQKTKIVA